MKVLHIVNDFGGTEVYKNLFQNLDNLGIQQIIFVPLNPRVRYRAGNHDFVFKTQGSKIIYSYSQKWFHKYFYTSKINSVVKDLRSKIDLREIDLIHTGTLCMTGAVAYEISLIYKIPYIVAIRNTDINAYFKKIFWKKNYFYSILENSSKIIFISPQYKKDCFEKIFTTEVVKNISHKTHVIPNGIINYFLENRVTKIKVVNNIVNIVYAGGFSENKNLLRLIKAIDILNEKNYNVQLTAIGKSLPNRAVSKAYGKLIEEAARDKDYIQLLEYKKADELCEIYTKANIFAMVSIRETFGLSYVEALTQGLPILYTKGQGFDGFYDDGFIGKAVNATDENSIVEGLLFILKNYVSIANNVINIDLNKEFNWESIASIYVNLYNDILNKND